MWDVFFDDLRISHRNGAIIEETHYYPFGLTMQAISSKAANRLKNSFKYNGGNLLESNEISDGSGLEWYDAKNRIQDPQLGRFWQIDPLSDMSLNNSPYIFGSNNPILINDPLGLYDSIPLLSPVYVTAYVTDKFTRFSDWFTGANVGYSGSGWGHGPRQWMASQFGLGNNANNLWELGLHSQFQSSQVNLTGDLLNKLKADPAMVAFQKKIIAILKADPRFGKLAFVTKGGDGVEFGGQRWSSSNENWGVLNSSNPALHGKTWAVAGNELTWAVRHAKVDYTATVKTDGTIVISFHLSDRFDLSAQSGRSEAYNNISSAMGFLYHDIVGGNSAMKVNANWETTIK